MSWLQREDSPQRTPTNSTLTCTISFWILKMSESIISIRIDPDQAETAFWDANGFRPQPPGTLVKWTILPTPVQRDPKCPWLCTCGLGWGTQRERDAHLDRWGGLSWQCKVEGCFLPYRAIGDYHRHLAQRRALRLPHQAELPPRVSKLLSARAYQKLTNLPSGYGMATPRAPIRIPRSPSGCHRLDPMSTRLTGRH